MNSVAVSKAQFFLEPSDFLLHLLGFCCERKSVQPVEKAVDFYADQNDVLILISSSGKSKNMINACKSAKNKKISKIITFTGHNKDNPLSKLGDINFWINSKAYNFVENTHQVWLLTICDLIIGKREYLPN